VYGKIWSGNLLREPAKFADSNDEVTERDTSTKFFARREIFAAKIVRDEKKKPRGTICQVAESLMPQRWCRGVSEKRFALASPNFSAVAGNPRQRCIFAKNCGKRDTKQSSDGNPFPDSR
jgi:hypothetical protein